MFQEFSDPENTFHEQTKRKQYKSERQKSSDNVQGYMQIRRSPAGGMLNKYLPSALIRCVAERRETQSGIDDLHNQTRLYRNVFQQQCHCHVPAFPFRLCESKAT
jgi:hypothetical protein